MLSPRRILPAFLFVLVTSACADPATPVEVIQTAIERLDADGAAAGPVAFEARGTLNQAAELQGSRPGARDEARVLERIALRTNGEVSHRYRIERIDGSVEDVREVYSGDSVKTIHVLDAGFSVTLAGGPEAAGGERIARRFPMRLLREALARPEALRFDRGADGGGLEVVVPTPERDLVLGFDRDRRLTHARYELELPGLGRRWVTWRWTGFGTFEGAGATPSGYRVDVGDVTFLDMSVEALTTDEATIDSMFARPAGHAEPRIVRFEAGARADARARVDTLGGGVYRVLDLRTGFHPLFVDTDEGVVAFDAPAGYPLLLELPAGDVAPGPGIDWLSERYVELIREAVPDRPIAAVVLTHLHGDHAGGVPAFARAGARIVAPAADTTALRELLDAAGLDSRGVAIEGVSDPATVGSGTNAVEVLPVGPLPHAENVLVGWVPAAGILFHSDMIGGGEEEILAALDEPQTAGFLGRVRDRAGLDHIYSMHAGAPIPGDAWERILGRLEERGGTSS